MKTFFTLILCLVIAGVTGAANGQSRKAAAATSAARYFKIDLALKFGAVPAQGPAMQSISTEVAVRAGKPGSCKARMISQVPTGMGGQTKFVDLGTKLDCNDVHVEGNALALQFTLDASRIKQMVKSKAADGSPMEEPLITQRTVQLTVRLPLNKTETVFDSSTHAMKPLGPVGLKPGEGGPAPAMGEDVPLVIEMTATELL